MAKSALFTSRMSLVFQRPKPTIVIPISFSFLKVPSPCRGFLSLSSNPKSLPLVLRTHFSTTATPYPLQYDMIISRPVQQPAPARRRPRVKSPKSLPNDSVPENEEEIGFDEWVDRKLNSATTSSPSELTAPDDNNVTEMDRSKKKYYNKRRKRMYGSDSEEENGRRDDNDSVELKQEVVELRTLHKREEELYFYDAFAYPWEKDKHYKMVYQLEKKYFPDQCFDKAFLEPGQWNESVKRGKKRVKGTEEIKKKEVENKGLVFFDDEDRKNAEKEESGVVKVDVSEKKVEEFFKCLKKVPNKDRNLASTEPFLSSRSIGLPPKWDSPGGTVVLVNKPKGELLYISCKHFVKELFFILH